MKYHELKVGMRVEDKHYNSDHQVFRGPNDWGVGRIVAILKTRFKVQFSNKNIPESENGLITYDKSHAQFIQKVKRRNRG